MSSQWSLSVPVLAFILTLASAVAADDWSVSSPDGQITLTIERDTKGSLIQSVECAGAVVIEPSPLGIMRTDQAFTIDLALVTAGPVTAHDSTYTLIHGKTRQARDHYNQRVLTFTNNAQARLELHLRAYDDGVAFRYRFPEDDPEPRTVIGEATSFQIPAQSRVWAMPFDEPNKYNPAYESFWQDAIEPGTPSPTRAGWTFPLLFHTPSDRWGLITEAALDGTYCGGRLASEAPGGLYRIRFPEPGEGNGTGSVEPSSTLPWATPWRVIVAGKSPGVMVETTLIENLNPPSALTDTSWIRPGRVSWSWLFDPDSPQDGSKLKQFVDLAAEMGWQYTLVDANWDIMRNGNIHDLIAHANARNVGVWLWYNSGGGHNIVTERPRGMMTLRDVRRYEFERLAQWGVKGVKIDFFQSDKQNIIALYHEILQDAADFKIMVNFHGCTLPRGWSRTYPHLMTMEAVRGEENYQFEPRFPAYAPRHNTTLPFTRNAVGPMDYTPVMFRDNNNALVTTPGHEIALPIVFESGLLHFAGGAEEYLELAEDPRRFLSTIPVAWDETRFLQGEPGRFAVIARRSGTTWYVGGINGQSDALDLNLALDTLGDGPWRVTLIADGETPRTLESQSLEIPGDSAMPLKFPPHGGFAAILNAAAAP